MDLSPDQSPRGRERFLQRGVLPVTVSFAGRAVVYVATDQYLGAAMTTDTADVLAEALKRAESKFWTEEGEWAKAGSGQTKDQQAGAAMVWAWLRSPQGGLLHMTNLRAALTTKPSPSEGTE